MAEERFILAIDGGGMRGIIPAYILSRLSAMLKAEGDTRPLYSHFDLAAGTSTGALIAGAAKRRKSMGNTPIGVSSGRRRKDTSKA